MHKIFISNSINPYFNLAFEEYLLNNISSKDNILFLWQNENTIVIGRNQNPWKECNLEELKKQKGKLVRRLSGGGAVYHDLGNLNFTFISEYNEGIVKENVEKIIDVLILNGIKAEFNGKNDILSDGYKISGNAYFIEDNMICHHGTLLVECDVEKMVRLLTVSQKKLESKGIDSIKSRVINIKDLNNNITVESLKIDLTKNLTDYNINYAFVDENKIESKDINLKTVIALMKKYESWEWNFGASPEFNVEFNEKYSWGEIIIYLFIKDGKIMKVKSYTDALDVNLPKKIESLLLNTEFDDNKIEFLMKNIK
ncbi:lipoate--protein ligase [Anaerovorax odorimutans]|uniref:lipoate--protein ligase n=1 Tax=Anaerovorax odorimutans TaxID=109327 RepID=UPI0004138309|nr:lipoate--protein ligase [Anaerovorax odorimutans]